MVYSESYAWRRLTVYLIDERYPVTEPERQRYGTDYVRDICTIPRDLVEEVDVFGANGHRYE